MTRCYREFVRRCERDFARDFEAGERLREPAEGLPVPAREVFFGGSRLAPCAAPLTIR